MKSERVIDALGQVNDKYIDEASPANRKSEKAALRHTGRRLSVALIAAIVALCLMGAGVVAVIFGDSIQNWFEHQWEAITGQSMSEGQTAVIDHLSQKIDISQTIGDTTVTVDSATIGDGTFYLLLRVGGLRLSDKYSYTFDEVLMEATPDPLKGGGGLGGYGLQYQGLDGDGAALILIDYNYASADGYIKDTCPLEITLTLKDFVRNANEQKTLAKGEWSFEFALDRTQLSDAILLPDTETTVMDHEKWEEVPIVLTSIELTNTGIRFQFDYYEGTLVISDQINVVLKNGSVVGNNGGFGTPLKDSTIMQYSFQWQFPVDLNEVEAIQIGSAEIPVSYGE